MGKLDSARPCFRLFCMVSSFSSGFFPNSSIRSEKRAGLGTTFFFDLYEVRLFDTVLTTGHQTAKRDIQFFYDFGKYCSCLMLDQMRHQDLTCGYVEAGKPLAIHLNKEKEEYFCSKARVVPKTKRRVYNELVGKKQFSARLEGDMPPFRG